MSSWRKPGPITTEPNWFAPASTTCDRQRPPRRMGPGFRQDDEGPLHRHLAMEHRRARGEAFRRIDDRIRVDAVVAIEVGDGAGLAELLDAERLDAVAADTTE